MTLRTNSTSLRSRRLVGTGVMDLLVTSLVVLVLASKVVVVRDPTTMEAPVVDRILDSTVQTVVQVQAAKEGHQAARVLVTKAPMAVQVQAATEVHLATRAQATVIVDLHLAVLVPALAPMADLTRAQMAMARTLTLKMTLGPLIMGKAAA